MKGGEPDEETLGKTLLLLLGLFVIVMVVAYFAMLATRYYTGAGAKLGKNEFYILPNTQDASVSSMFSQDPNAADSTEIITRSSNQPGGIEFTYSLWMYLKGVPTTTDKNTKHKNTKDTNTKHHVFHKGSAIHNNGNIITKCPHIYLTYPTTGSNDSPQVKLHVEINTYRNITQLDHPTVSNFPVNKWVNVIVCVNQFSMNVYINGSLAQSYDFKGDIPKQNYGDVFMCMNNGYKGYLSKVKYYDRFIDYNEIHNIMMAGPAPPPTETLDKPTYLAYDFWMDN